ncbi:MAG: hypothetical protein UHI93_07500 [Acutalibacteraceae bacterium]|nr:hypothetical protein [Acutalibacteraceae bacterium]
MPQFDLRGIKAAKYVNTNGTITYTDAQTVGDAMNVNLELRFAEGRLYAESTLAEYMRKAVGGTISIGVKYIPSAAQIMMFNSRSNSRSITYTPEGGTSTTVSAAGLVIGRKTTSAYVGVAFYAPDMVDGVEKYTCVKIARALFGPPSMTLQTAGESITFNTPTVSGEFMADDSANGDLIEVAIVDDEEAAIAWVTAVLA